MRATSLRLAVHPLSANRWADFERLFGEHGACGGCWCMLWRLSAAEFRAGKGEGNRRAMKSLVDSGITPGLLAYVENEPVGWIAVARRDKYPGLQRSRVLRPFDDLPVWSVSCFFVARAYRRQGVSKQLLDAAAEFVCGQGGRILEGYPQVPRKPDMPDVFAWTGLVSVFRKAGYRECARRSPTRPIMRLVLGQNSGK